MALVANGTCEGCKPVLFKQVLSSYEGKPTMSFLLSKVVQDLLE